MNLNEYNVYCDESCHLEHDNSNVMVLGAICCPKNSRLNIFKDIRKIKKDFGLSNSFEIKWTKVGDKKADFYIELIKYFIENNELSFRGLIVPNKKIIDNEQYCQSWDTFYYKMYYYLLRNLITFEKSYNIYIDIKDTNGSKKREKLLDILNTIKNEYLYSENSPVKNLQAVQSKEVELIQLTDLIIGALCYENRGLSKEKDSNAGKLKIIEYLENTIGIPLTISTPPNESKFNIFKINLKDNCKCLN